MLLEPSHISVEPWSLALKVPIYELGAFLISSSAKPMPSPPSVIVTTTVWPTGAAPGSPSAIVEVIASGMYRHSNLDSGLEIAGN